MFYEEKNYHHYRCACDSTVNGIFDSTGTALQKLSYIIAHKRQSEPSVKRNRWIKLNNIKSAIRLVLVMLVY